MSLTYATLQTEVANYLARGNLTSKIPGFITRGENLLNSRLKVIAMESIEPMTLASGSPTIAFSAIATKIRETKRVWRQVDDVYQEMVKLNSKQFLDQRTTQTGEPTFWTVMGETIYFDQTADQNYTLQAHLVRGFDIATDSTNWLSENHEEAYLYAALAQAEPYIKNDSRITLWKSLLDEAIADITREDAKRRGDNNNVIIPEISTYVGIRRAYNIFTE